MITHIVFDFDGTLIDSMEVHTNKIKHLLHTQGISMPDGLINILTPLGDIGSGRYLRETFHLSIPLEEMARIVDSYALEKYTHSILPKPGAIEYAKQLKAAGFPLFILSASKHRMIDPCANRLGFDSLMEQIYSTEDFGLVKTDPALFAALAERLGTRPECIAFFDDNLHALKTAKACGLYTVGVHDPSSQDDEEKIRALADTYLSSFTEAIDAAIPALRASHNL